MEAVLFSNLDSFKSVPIYHFRTLYLYLVVHLVVRLQIHSPYLTVSVLQPIAAPNQVTLNAQDFLLPNSFGDSDLRRIDGGRI